METDADKIKRIRKELELTQQQFADRCGVKQQLVAMIENGTRAVTAAFELGFLKAFGYDFKTGETFERERLRTTLIGGINTVLTSTYSNQIPIPFYSAKASAGTGEELPEYQESNILHFDRRWLQNVVGINPDNATIIQAKGDSMQPLIKDGDLLMVDISQKEPVNGQIFVVRIEKELFVKRVSKEWNGDWILISENKEYDNIIPDSYTEVIGRVVYNASKETL